MTKPIGGEVVEAAAHPDLLAPGTVRRPEWIRPEDWARMPWPAQWRAARRPAPVRPPVSVPVVVPTHPVEDIDRRRAAVLVEAGQLRPCGTKAAYNRHVNRGEKPCDDCRAAARMLRRIARARRSTGLSTGAVDGIACAAQDSRHAS